MSLFNVRSRDFSDHAYEYIKCPTVANYERNSEVNIFRCEFGNKVPINSPNCTLAKVNCGKSSMSMYKQ